MKEQLTERQNINYDHKVNPKVGDYWHDHLCPICLITSVTNTHVTIIEDVDRDVEGWMWDFAKRKTVTREVFKDMHRYATIPGYWADVIPERHKNLIPQP